MPRSGSRFVVLLLFLLVSRVVCAQTDPVQNAESPETVNQKKAYDLLETVASRITDLQSPDNRIAISCEVAELIWSKDEKRARTLFENVIKEMSAIVDNIDLSDPQSSNNVGVINQLRQDTVGRIARCDPELALTFLRSTRFTTEPTYNGSFERNLELYLSRVIAAKDPELAAKVARESLSRGFSYDLVNVVTELYRKNPAAAQSLYEAIVERVKEVDLVRNSEAAGAACNLLNSFQPPKANLNTFRDLLDAVVKVALSLNPGNAMTLAQVQNFHNNISVTMPLIEKYLPGRALAVKQWSQSIRRTLDPNAQMYSEINEVTQNGTVDDILALAQKYSPEMRPSLYQQAVWKAVNQGDTARARQVASEMISDPVQRRQMLDQIDRSIAWKAINESKIAEARALLRRSGSIDLRIQGLVHIANLLAGKEDKKTAIECLDEARALVADSARNSQRMWFQLQLASAYSDLDVNQSFTLVDGMVDQLNSLIAAAVVMDGFENQYLKNGEWMATGASSLGNVVNNLRRTLGELSRREFDRAETVAERFERPEIRLMAQVDIAHAVLLPENVARPARRFVRLRN